MKRVVLAGLCLCLLALCACGQTTAEEATGLAAVIDPEEVALFADVIKKYFEAYYECLNDESLFMESHYYALHDFDGDGAKLIIAKGTGYRGESGVMYPYAIYSIQNGVAVRHNEFDSYAGDSINGIDMESLFFENGTIKQENWYLSCIFYYRFEAGELVKTCLMDDYGAFSYLGFKRITKQDEPQRHITGAKCKRIKKEFEGDGQTIELDWKPLADYGR